MHQHMDGSVKEHVCIVRVSSKTSYSLRFGNMLGQDGRAEGHADLLMSVEKSRIH